MAVSVFGNGAIGSAIVQRLQQDGHVVNHGGREAAEQVAQTTAEVTMLALTHGDEVAALLPKLRDPGCVLDLTTHSSRSTRLCALLAHERGLCFHGGGLAGGSEQVRRGEAVLLIGPPAPLAVRHTAQALGEVVDFPDAPRAAHAKLIHNTLLLLHQTALAHLLGQVHQDEVARLIHVLEVGTTGRALRDSSLLRDVRGNAAASSYKTRLVLKDLDEIRAELPNLPEAMKQMLDLVEVIGRDSAGEEPFTRALIEVFHAG